MFEALDQRCDGHCGLPHAVLTSESVRHVSFILKQLVDPFVKTMAKTRLTHLQGEELVCPAEDDEPVMEPVDEPTDEPVDESVDEVGGEPAEEQVELCGCQSWTSE